MKPSQELVRRAASSDDRDGRGGAQVRGKAEMKKFGETLFLIVHAHEKLSESGLEAISALSSHSYQGLLSHIAPLQPKQIDMFLSLVV